MKVGSGNLRLNFFGLGAWGSALARQWSPSHQIFSSRPFSDADSFSDLIVVAVSTPGLDEALEFVRPFPVEIPVLVATKGIHPKNHLPAPIFFQNSQKDRAVGVLSGPTFAGELSQNALSWASLAFSSTSTAQYWAENLTTPELRILPSSNVVGVSLGGIYKNIIAILSGILQAMRVPDNTWAMVMNASLMEWHFLARTMGAEEGTLWGPSGLGDTLLTATSHQSRNFSFGWNLIKHADLSPEPSETVEGRGSLAEIQHLTAKLKIELPLLGPLTALVQEPSSSEGRKTLLKVALHHPFYANYPPEKGLVVRKNFGEP